MNEQEDRTYQKGMIYTWIVALGNVFAYGLIAAICKSSLILVILMTQALYSYRLFHGYENLLGAFKVSGMMLAIGSFIFGLFLSNSPMRMIICFVVTIYGIWSVFILENNAVLFYMDERRNGDRKSVV